MARRACDGPSCCPVTEFRDSISLKSLWRSVTPVTVHPAIPLRSSESRFQYPIFRFSKCFETRPCDGPSCPWRSVVGSIVSASFSRIEVCCSKRLNRSLQISTIILEFIWLFEVFLLDFSFIWLFVKADIECINFFSAYDSEFSWF